ncbi:hypothetical protein DERP_000222 [Dermatophagoides pteronyssinus]|uniref:Uncharacterized protein n=1 Tax=Dermatophagoides pteronyssinus TaxID=6956 RepID=A0ABQ8IZK0_DERPT|nr:hypothetical protein DERP_000222 [Dermatophagoides pteronyssinus]
MDNSFCKCFITIIVSHYHYHYYLELTKKSRLPSEIRDKLNFYLFRNLILWLFQTLMMKNSFEIR